MTTSRFIKVQQAIREIAQGKFVIVIDEESRENEGDLIFAGEAVTLEKMAFILNHTTGILCAALPAERLQHLNLFPMVQDNRCPFRTAFSVSVDAAQGVTTGVSAADRMRVVQLLASPDSCADDFIRPGHFFPLAATKGGVLKRAGHTEAALDLVTLAGMQPCGVLAELVNPDHSMMRSPGILNFGAQYGITVISVADLIAYRMATESLIQRVSSSLLSTQYGKFTIHIYESLVDGTQHIALVKGEVEQKEDVPVRLHSECSTGDIFFSTRCDCGYQLEAAMKYIEEQGHGIILYLRDHEGRGIGLANKIRAYAEQDQGCDTVDANLRIGCPVDARNYGLGAQILAELGVVSIQLITNNPSKYQSLKNSGVNIAGRIAFPVFMSEDNRTYLQTKQQRLGHWLNFSCVEKIATED